MKYAVTSLIALIGLVLAVIWVAIPHPAYADTSIFGNISSDTTWYTGEVYIVYGNIAVNPGVRLTVEPGTIVKFNYEASLTVFGELAANGTAADKIYFTAIRDDTVGGDSNGDGSATSPQIGDWAKIIVAAGASVNLNYSVVRFGGTWPQYTNIFQGGGTLKVANSTTEFSNNGFRIAGGATTIENSLIKDNHYGLEAIGPGSLILNNNTFTNNITGSAFVSFNEGKSFISSGNTASGNGQNGIVIYGTMNTDQTWTDQMPYIILNITIPSGKTLTVNAGTKVKFNFEGSMTVLGGLDVNGTSGNKVYFTSIRDDTTGGDTNSDGFSSGARGDWNQITIASGASVDLNHSVVRFGGGGWPVYSNISLSGGSLLMSDSVISSGSTGLRIYGGWANINASAITGNSYGILIEGGGVAISNSSVYDNTEYGMYNGTFLEMNAENNWWGDTTGPYNFWNNSSGQGDKVSTWVDFDPWLTASPSPISAKEPVLIIPGIVGTELKNGDDLIWADLNQMFWDINDQFITENLALNDNGDSVNQIIASKAIEQIPDIPIIDAGAFNVDTFKSLREDLETNSAYVLDQDLFYFPYDWRLDLNETAPLLAARIEEIKSQTGADKINIVAHSMGGLLTKEYIRQNGKESIDKLIFVGTPHIGAPKAGKIILEGDKMGIPWLEKDRVEEIGEHSIAVHELLPSPKYFDIAGAYINQGGTLDYGQTRNLLVSEGSALNVFSKAEDFFSLSLEEIDLSDINVYNIAGCSGGTQGGYQLRPDNSITTIKYRAGDQTVPLVSGDYITISAENKFYSTEGAHAELPSRQGIRDLIADILNDDQLVSYDNLSNDLSICGIKGKELIWRSPVEVHIYDSQGNHTGPVENNAIEYGITGVDYEIVGHEKFIFLPTKNGEMYQVLANGLDTGTFDLIIHDNEDGSLTGETVFNDVPVTNLTEVSFSVTDEQVDSIDVDRDGNGISDAGYLSNGGWMPYNATIQSTLDDLERIYLLGWIEGEVKNSLESLLKATLSTETTTKSKGKQAAGPILGVAFLNKLESEYNGDRINQQAYNILKKDIEWLLRSYDY